MTVLTRLFNSAIIGVLIIIFMSPIHVSPTWASSKSIPATIVSTGQEYQTIRLRGVRLDPHNPLRLQFTIDLGDSDQSAQELQEEATRLIKYFLVSLTVPDSDKWVNLSPYESNRVVPDNFGGTVMGRDLLDQDYMLKKMTASMIYPEVELGAAFWNDLRQRAREELGTDDIPFQVFHKVWIIPDVARIYQDQDMAYVTDSHLKVMLEKDYYAQKRSKGGDEGAGGESAEEEIVEALLKEWVLPAISHEVNHGDKFVRLRQIYDAMILATWFKKSLKDSVLNHIYVGRSKLAGVDIADKDVTDRIYQDYLLTFQRGVFNYVREEIDDQTGGLIPRQYVSGGISRDRLDEVLQVSTNSSEVRVDRAMTVDVDLEPEPHRDWGKGQESRFDRLTTRAYWENQILTEGGLKGLVAAVRIADLDTIPELAPFGNDGTGTIHVLLDVPGDQNPTQITLDYSGENMGMIEISQSSFASLYYPMIVGAVFRLAENNGITQVRISAKDRRQHLFYRELLTRHAKVSNERPYTLLRHGPNHDPYSVLTVTLAQLELDIPWETMPEIAFKKSLVYQGQHVSIYTDGITSYRYQEPGKDVGIKFVENFVAEVTPEFERQFMIAFDRSKNKIDLVTREELLAGKFFRVVEGEEKEMRFTRDAATVLDDFTQLGDEKQRELAAHTTEEVVQYAGWQSEILSDEVIRFGVKSRVRFKIGDRFLVIRHDEDTPEGLWKYNAVGGHYTMLPETEAALDDLGIPRMPKPKDPRRAGIAEWIAWAIDIPAVIHSGRKYIRKAYKSTKKIVATDTNEPKLGDIKFRTPYFHYFALMEWITQRRDRELDPVREIEEEIVEEELSRFLTKPEFDALFGADQSMLAATKVKTIKPGSPAAAFHILYKETKKGRAMDLNALITQMGKTANISHTSLEGNARVLKGMDLLEWEVPKRGGPLVRLTEAALSQAGPIFDELLLFKGSEAKSTKVRVRQLMGLEPLEADPQPLSVASDDQTIRVMPYSHAGFFYYILNPDAVKQLRRGEVSDAIPSSDSDRIISDLQATKDLAFLRGRDLTVARVNAVFLKRFEEWGLITRVAISDEDRGFIVTKGAIENAATILPLLASLEKIEPARYKLDNVGKAIGEIMGEGKSVVLAAPSDNTSSDSVYVEPILEDNIVFRVSEISSALSKLAKADYPQSLMDLIAVNRYHSVNFWLSVPGAVQTLVASNEGEIKTYELTPAARSAVSKMRKLIRLYPQNEFRPRENALAELLGKIIFAETIESDSRLMLNAARALRPFGIEINTDRLGASTVTTRPLDVFDYLVGQSGRSIMMLNLVNHFRPRGKFIDPVRAYEEYVRPLQILGLIHVGPERMLSEKTITLTPEAHAKRKLVRQMLEQYSLSTTTAEREWLRMTMVKAGFQSARSGKVGEPSMTAAGVFWYLTQQREATSVGQIAVDLLPQAMVPLDYLYDEVIPILTRLGLVSTQPTEGNDVVLTLSEGVGIRARQISALLVSDLAPHSRDEEFDQIWTLMNELEEDATVNRRPSVNVDFLQSLQFQLDDDVLSEIHRVSTPAEQVSESVEEKREAGVLHRLTPAMRDNVRQKVLTLEQKRKIQKLYGDLIDPEDVVDGISLDYVRENDLLESVVFLLYTDGLLNYHRVRKSNGEDQIIFRLTNSAIMGRFEMINILQRFVDGDQEVYEEAALDMELLISFSAEPLNASDVPTRHAQMRYLVEKYQFRNIGGVPFRNEEFQPVGKRNSDGLEEVVLVEDEALLNNSDENLGGIDMSSELLTIMTTDSLEIIKNESLDYVPSLGHQPIGGFTPVIINMTPVTTLPLILGEDDSDKSFDVSYGNELSTDMLPDYFSVQRR